jgi:hypothetical protein
MTTLVTLFEMGIVTAARRHHVAGYPKPIQSADWINEIYPSWFATCQIDPEQAFSGQPVRDGGEWIYVDRESYIAWRNASFGVLAAAHNPQVNTAENSETGVERAEAKDSPSNPMPEPETARPTGRGGAKPKYDWPAFDAEVMRRAGSNERPHSIRAFASQMLSWCAESWDSEPSESTVRARISRLLGKNGLISP